MASQQGSNLTGNGAKPADDDDELLLLSSPSPSSDEPVKSNSKRDALPTNKKSKRSPSTHDIVNVEDDLDLEILEEVTSIPEASVSGSNSESESSEEEEEDLEEEEDEEEEDDESMSLEGGKINIQYSHGSFFLWDAEDVQMLRDECRIVGKLVGCLPRAPRQNIQLGLPLQLMPEEARLLVEIDAAALVIEKPVSDSTLKARKAAFDNVRQQNFQIQQRLYKEHRKEEVSQRMDSIIAGKKAKKRKLQEEGNQSDQTSEDSVTKEVEDKNSFAEESNEKSEDKEIDNLTVDDIVTTETSEEHALVQIFTQTPWKQSFMQFKTWSYPSTERDMLRYLVFKDLWGKGFFLTSGAKFGGDFLVYPGDPSRYHSHYIAVCRSQFDEMPCLDLVSLGRLSSNVRKTALLCALDRNRKVTYTSLTWTGIS